MNEKKVQNTGREELAISGKWPVNPNPKTGEIPRIFYSRESETLTCEFSNGVFEEKEVKCYSSNATCLLTLWNKHTLLQKWTTEGMKALNLDKKPYMAIDENTGVIFGGFASVVKTREFLQKHKERFKKLNARVSIYVMKEGLVELVTMQW